MKIPDVKVTLISGSLFPERTRFFIETIRAVLAAALAAVSTLNVIGLCEKDTAFL
jgi:hypothetical protein